MSIQSTATFKMDKVSVIIPTYNSVRWIEQTLKSVLKQTHLNLEIIIVDDGSTDKTVQAIKNIVDWRIKFFPYQHLGAATARNLGIQHSTGEFIAFLDSDDLWAPRMIERHLSALQRYQTADVAYCWTYCINEEDKCLWPLPPTFYEGNVYSKLVTENFLACGSIVARRSAIDTAGQFDSQLEFGEDYDYWLRLALHAQFILIPRYQLIYRIRSGSQMKKLYSDKSKVESYINSLSIIRQKGIDAAPNNSKNWQIFYNLNTADIHLEYYIRQGEKHIDNINESSNKIKETISLKPHILLSITTNKLIMKLLIAKFFSHHLASYLIKFFQGRKNQASIFCFVCSAQILFRIAIFAEASTL